MSLKRSRTKNPYASIKVVNRPRGVESSGSSEHWGRGYVTYEIDPITDPYGSTNYE